MQYKTIEPKLMRVHNLTTVLRLLWRQTSLSRADIASLTGMSRSTVSDLIQELMDCRLLEESGIGHSKGGRRPIMLKFSEHTHFLIGIQISRYALTFVLMDLRGRVLNNINTKVSAYLLTQRLAHI